MAAAEPQESRTTTVTETTTEEQGGSTTPTVRLKLQKPNTEKKVQWTEETVDNEYMNKKKSKCCCVYQKPRMFGESSDESDDEDCSFHCRGHRDKCYKEVPHDHNGQPGPSGSGPSGNT